MTIHLTRYGSGVPVVLFHGWGFDSQVWKPLMPCLQDHYQLICVDLPGFGLTPIMDWLAFKEKLLVQLPNQFAVVGWSMGGLYATRLSLEEPQCITHLLNICSSPCFLLDDNWPGVAQSVFTTFYQKLSLAPYATLTEFIQLQVSKSKIRLEPGYPPTQEGLALGLEILDTWDFRKELKEIKHPICYMFGKLDPIVPSKTMETMQMLYPDLNYVFFNRAAHMPFLSHIDLFVHELQEFIK